VTTYKTTRFGELNVNETEIINFAEGLLGFENLTKFFVVDPSDNTLILWLQSAEDEKIAFPIIEPKIFSPDYVVKLTTNELNLLALENVNTSKIYSILTIPQNVIEMSANLKAPIVINPAKRIAKQVVLQDSKLSIKHEMYKELKTYIVNFSSDDSKNTDKTTVKATKRPAEVQA
jgi:flagellar assembly factor FliW